MTIEFFKSYRDFNQNSGIVIKFNKDFDQNYLQALHNHGIVILEVAAAL